MGLIPYLGSLAVVLILFVIDIYLFRKLYLQRLNQEKLLEGLIKSYEEYPSRR